MDTEFSVDVHFFRLSAELQPYFTALTQFDIVCHPDSLIEDLLHPEWAAMRFTLGPPPVAAIGPGPMERQTPFVVSGPTSMGIRFGVGTSRIIGLGLQPAGWERFVDGAACDFADRTINGLVDHAFALFAPILSIAQDSRATPEEIAGRIDAYLIHRSGTEEPRVAQVRLVHAALNDPEIANVVDLAEQVGLSPRSLERICLRSFGFPPKLMLRRQRFLRSLARFMLDPRRNWSEALDDQYHDQAQFVRDFRSFMGMTPSEYAERPHPILNRIMAQRMADIGAGPETDLPTMLRYLENSTRRDRSGDVGRAGLGK